MSARSFVMNFEWDACCGQGRAGCLLSLSPVRGIAYILEYNGDIFSCDHFMYPAYRLGNIRDGRLKKMVRSTKQNTFGASKERPSRTVPGCDYLFACRGGCRNTASPRLPKENPDCITSAKDSKCSMITSILP